MSDESAAYHARLLKEAQDLAAQIISPLSHGHEMYVLAYAVHRLTSEVDLWKKRWSDALELARTGLEKTRPLGRIDNDVGECIHFHRSCHGDDGVSSCFDCGAEVRIVPGSDSPR